VRGLKKSFLSAFTKRSKKEKTGSSTEPPHDANIVLCAGHATPDWRLKMNSIRDRVNELESSINNQIAALEKEYEFDGSRGVIIDNITKYVSESDKKVRLGVAINKRVLVKKSHHQV
jgi:hypothetical protein